MMMPMMLMMLMMPMIFFHFVNNLNPSRWCARGWSLRATWLGVHVECETRHTRDPALDWCLAASFVSPKSTV